MGNRIQMNSQEVLYKMKLTILGTGNAKVTKCYNTCFTLNEGKEYFMIDGGGGSTILKQLEDAGISYQYDFCYA